MKQTTRELKNVRKLSNQQTQKLQQKVAEQEDVTYTKKAASVNSLNTLNEADGISRAGINKNEVINNVIIADQELTLSTTTTTSLHQHHMMQRLRVLEAESKVSIFPKSAYSRCTCVIIRI